jgi:hypothetical protein
LKIKGLSQLSGSPFSFPANPDRGIYQLLYDNNSRYAFVIPAEAGIFEKRGFPLSRE